MSIDVYYQNARGLRTKTNNFFVNVLESHHDVIIITETWLCNGIENSELFDDRYDVYRKDRHDTSTVVGGGILIAVSRSLTSSLWNIDLTGFESLSVKVTKNNVNVFINAVYIPPLSPFTFYLDYFSIFESCYGVLNSNLLVIGDFNIPSIDGVDYDFTKGTSLVKAFGNFMSLCHLNSYNIIKNVNGRTLDLILANFEVRVRREEFPLVAEDGHHPALDVNLQLRGNVPDSHTSISEEGIMDFSLNFRKGNYLELYDQLRNVEWNDLFACTDINQSLEIFYNKVYVCLKDCIRPRIMKSYDSKYPCWFTPEIIADIKRKNRLNKKRKYSRYHDNLFRELRSSIKSRIRICYQSYLARVELNIKSDCRQFWNFIKSRRRGKFSESVMHLNGLEYKYNSIPQGFADYFSSVYTSPAASMSNVNNLVDCYSTNFKINESELNTNSFNLCLTVNSDEILAAIKKTQS
jgi:hypothetical protein